MRSSTPGRAARTGPPRGPVRYAVPAVLAPVAATVADLCLPAAIGRVVSALSAGRNATPALEGLGIILVAAVVANVVGAFAAAAYVAARTAAVRGDVARSVIVSPPRGRSTADLVTRLLVDARQPAAVLLIATSIVLSVAGVVVGLTLLALVDWVLLAGVLAGLLTVVLLLRRLVDDLTDLYQRYRRAQGEVGQRLLDVQAGAVTVRAAGTWLREVRRVLVPMHEVRAAGEALWAVQGRFAWRTSLFAPSILLVTIAVAGWSLSVGRIGVGGFTAAVGYAVVVLGGLDGVEAAAGLGAVRAGRARLAELHSGEVRSPAAAAGSVPDGRSEPDGRSAPEDVNLDDGKLDDVTLQDVILHDVILRDVGVDAEDGRPILDRISLRIPAGAFVAVTGASGSGCSTLARVIAGLVEPTRGSVLVGGRPVAGPTASDGVRATAFGRSRPALLGGTIAGLVGLGVDAGPGAVREAARVAHVLDVVDALPLGFQTPIEDVELSGGELQRLAIAQALARRSRVLVLDDVTAGLDPATEREVLGALLAARAGRTLVVVTNREAVLRRADAVIRIEGGALVRPPHEVGTSSSGASSGASSSGQSRSVGSGVR